MNVKGMGFQPAAPSIVLDISITQNIQIHFRYISTSGFSKLTQKYKHTPLIVVLHCYRSILSNTMSIVETPIFHSIIWYLAYTHSDRFETFTIGMICFSQGDLSIKGWGPFRSYRVSKSENFDHGFGRTTRAPSPPSIWADIASTSISSKYSGPRGTPLGPLGPPYRVRHRAYHI